MGKYEEDLIYNNNSFSAFIRCWFHFNDALYGITCSLAQLNNFKSYLVTRMPTITFNMEHSQELITFLDVVVTKTESVKTKV